MKLLLMTIVSLAVTSTSFAQDRRLVKQQIQDLGIKIERDAPYSDASLTDLQEAKTLLREALNLVNNRGTGNSNVYKLCLNYAYEKYKRQYSNSDALQRAQTKCRTVADMDVLKFLFEKHFRVSSNGDAMDLATRQADRRVKGRLELIKFAYSKHFRVTNSSDAATKSVKNMYSLKRNRGSLACFNQYYPVHSRTNNPSVAMDKTVETCSLL